ncbi:MAG: putative porin [Bacteroidales bacterium]|nr:putative porin [Bacteroidales bacterium]
MKRLGIILLIVGLWCCTGVFAQLNNGANGQYSYSATGYDAGNRDRQGNPRDTTAVNDANTVPIGLKAWRIDSRFGNITDVPVDSLLTGFQNSNDNGGTTLQFNHLGNLGAPRQNRIFFNREEESQSYFADPYDFSVVKANTMSFTNTLSPYTDIRYYKSFSSKYSEEHFKSYFAVNVNKKLGFGFHANYLYGRGMYTAQSTAFFNGGVWATYRGDKYDLHALLNMDNLKMTENGGITDDRYITDPVDMAEGKKQYDAIDIPVNFSKMWNHNTNIHFFLTHRINLGFYKEMATTTDDTPATAEPAAADSTSVTAPQKAEPSPPAASKNTETMAETPENAQPDSTATPQREFVAVTSIIHTVQLDLDKRRFISYDNNNTAKYYANQFFTDSTDIMKHNAVKNTFALQLREGFNKWAKAGLTAFITHEWRQFTLPDSVPGSNLRATKDYKENNLSIGGELRKAQGKALHYTLLGEYHLTGADAGQYQLTACGDLNMNILKDSVSLGVNAYVKNLNPIFYFRHFHSKHYWWDSEEMEKTLRTRIEGHLTSKKLGTALRVGVENIKNLTYLENVSEPVTKDGKTTAWKNNATVSQCGDNIQVANAMLRQQFRLGILHLDAEVTYQKTSNASVLPLPEWNCYGNLYIKTTLAKKVLKLEMGAEVAYFSKYNAPDYSPVIGQYYLQNPENTVEIGGYPLVNPYINLHLKRTRIFLKMYNAYQPKDNLRYFWAPHYPLNPTQLRLGITWTFYD